MASSTETIPRIYSKRPGTAGIRGHLYETKLLSLIYFRAIHDDRIEDIHLATNVDKLGLFDDICFIVKLRGIDKPLTVFIQAKHRENNSVLTLNSRSDLAKYFYSYLEIRRQFKPYNKDVLFNGTFSERECLFVMYTTAKGDQHSKKYECNYSEHLNALIGTGDPGSQPMHDCNQDELFELVLEEQITALARSMAKCIFGKFNDIQMLMQDEIVLQYHVHLAQKLFDVSEVQTEGHRLVRFRRGFFFVKDKYLKLFKNELCSEIIKIRKLDSGHLELNVARFVNHVAYKNRNFFFDIIPSEKEKQYPHIIPDRIEVEDITFIQNVLECLPSPEFKVPASFGNKDLTIKGGDKKQNRKLNDLSSKIVTLLKQSKPSNIVIIDESMGKGFLQLSGGIASAVGNLLVFDDVSKLLKFNDNYESLGKLAKKLFDKLKVEIKTLFEYKFDVQVKIFPKHSFDVDKYSKKVVSEFFETFLFYTSQSHEEDVEKALIGEINDSQSDDVPNVEITSDAIFLKYHDEIQKWWMTPKVGEYLTKEGSKYKNAVKHTSSQPLISVINMMCKIKIKNLILNEDAVNSINIDGLPSGTVLVTENSSLTLAKLNKQLLNNKEYVVLDLKYILNLSARDDKTLRRELMNTNEMKTVFVVFDKAIITTSSKKKLENIANSIRDKRVILIAAQNSVENARNYFSLKDNVVKDTRSNLIDMSDESQKSIFENTKLIFQGDEVSLDQVLDDESIGYVGGGVLYKIMHSNKNVIGKPVSHSNYISKLHIERTVKRFKIQTQERRTRKVGRKTCYFETLYDIQDKVALIIGDPGMGKSTLLTYMSLKTKELNPIFVWILRINLLEYSKQFFEWQNNKTDIDTLESFKFLCLVALSEESSKKKNLEITLEELNNTMYLKDCSGSEWTIFELKMFLHYYNTKKLIILLDGFDEICPTYAHEVLALIKAIENFSRNHKLLITSRWYDKINTILELRLGKVYELKPLDKDQQERYLTGFWDEKEILENLKDVQIQNIYDLVTFLKTQSEKYLIPIKKKQNVSIQSKQEMVILAIYLSLVKYLKSKSMNHDWIRNMFASNMFLNNFIKIVPVLRKLNGFDSSPLHLQMVADYLYDQIKECYNKPKWDLETHIFGIYEGFLETKLKRIRFQEKNHYDMYTPDSIAHYNRVLTDFKEKHKKLAAYSLYYKSRSKLFDEDELKQFKDIITELKEGEERTGVICNVVNDIPIFVHSTIAEYFAVEYICDLLKTSGKSKSIWHFILNEMFFNCNKNVLAMLDAKVKIDKYFRTQILAERNKKYIFELLLQQSRRTKGGYDGTKTFLCEAIRHDLQNLSVLLLTLVQDNLDESDLMDFIKIVKETNMFMLAINMDFEKLIASIVNHVKVIDKSKLRLLFDNFEFNLNFDEVSTDELVHQLHKHVWIRMGVVPEWKNLSKFSGQIYFI